MKLYEIDNQWLNECNREQIILRLWPDGASYAIESLSKITKYEDVYTWQFLSKTISAHIEFWVTGGCSTCLPLWIHVPLFMNASLITLHSPSKTAKTRNYIPSLLFCLRSEPSSQRRTKARFWFIIHVSLFCLGQGKDVMNL